MSFFHLMPAGSFIFDKKCTLKTIIHKFLRETNILRNLSYIHLLFVFRLSLNVTFCCLHSGLSVFTLFVYSPLSLCSHGLFTAHYLDDHLLCLQFKLSMFAAHYFNLQSITSVLTHPVCNPSSLCSPHLFTVHYLIVHSLCLQPIISMFNLFVYNPLSLCSIS